MTSDTRNIILLCAAAGLAVGGYAYYRYAQNNTDFQFQSYNIDNVDDNNIATITLNFLITSKLGIGFTIKSVNTNLLVNNTPVGVANSSTVVTIPPNGSAILPIQTTIDTSSFATSEISALLGGGSNNLVVSGTTSFKINLPVIGWFNLSYAINDTTNI